MLKITIHEASATPRNTKAGQLIQQKAYVHLDGEPYPKEIKITQWADKSTGEIPQPYSAGDYTFSKKSFFVTKYNELGCSPDLVPIKK